MSLHDEHRVLTRRRVLQAVLDLVAEGSVDALSVPAVSRRSGVSLATIYRHFPTKDDLLTEASTESARQAQLNYEPADDDGDEFERSIYAMWPAFAPNLPLLRHQISSEPGRDLRRARLDEGRRQLATYIESFGIEPTSHEGQRLISLLLLIGGSVALIELHDRQELPVDEAIETSLWAARALIDATRPKP